MSDSKSFELYTPEELKALIEGEFPTFSSQVVCYDDENLELFNGNIAKRRGKLIIGDKLDESKRSKVLGAVDRAGLRLPYRCELYPSATSQRSDKYTQLGVKYSNIDDSFPTNPTFHNFNDWFLDWVDGRIVVPDTCFIQEHYLSEVVLPRVSEKLRIKIPRFVILELEAIGNRDYKSEEIKNEKKRLVFSAFNEVRRLQLEMGAIHFPHPIKGDYLANFSQIAGSKGVDSFIRLEIWDNTRGRSTRLEREDDMVLLTRDMIMACTASAEDIDTFYFSTAEPQKTEFYVNSNEVVSLLHETAVTFGEIRLKCSLMKEDLIIEGMWSGKDIMDWGKKRLKGYSP